MAYIGAVLSCSSVIWLRDVGREVVEVGRPYFTSLWELPAGLASNGLFWQCEGSPQPGHRYRQGWGPASRSRVSSGQRWKYRRPCRVCRVVSRLVFCQSSMNFSMALVLQTVYFGFQSVCKGLKLFMTWPKILVVLVQGVNVVVECFLNVQFIFDVLYLCSRDCSFLYSIDWARDRLYWLKNLLYCRRLIGCTLLCRPAVVAGRTRRIHMCFELENFILQGLHVVYVSQKLRTSPY